MFTLGFELDSNGQLAHIGLNSSDTTGYETPATLKDALKDLSVQNPCIVFSHLCDDENFKSSLSQWEIGTIAEACEIGTRLASSVIATKESVCPRFRPEEFGLPAQEA